MYKLLGLKQRLQFKVSLGIIVNIKSRNYSVFLKDHNYKANKKLVEKPNFTMKLSV
jgi:hypothetical protein